MADYYVDTTGNDSTGTGAIGAPYATPGKALGVAIAAAVAGFRIFVKVGTYTTTSTTSNVAGGVLNFSLTGSTTATNHMIGYTSTVGDGGRFTIQHGTGLAGTVVTFNNANSYNTLQNCEIIGNATSASRALAGSGRSNRAINFYARAFTGAGGVDIVNVGNSFSLKCFRISGGATGNNAALKIDSGGAYVEDGIVDGNAGRGVELGGGTVNINRIISCNHTTANGYGFEINNANEYAGSQLIAYGNAQSGFHQLNTQQTLTLTDCVAYGNGVNGFNFNSADALFLYGCAAGGNTSGNYAVTPNVNDGFISLASNPYANVATLDFTPGTSLKQISRLFPFLRTSGTNTSYRDIGTIGAQATGGSGGLIGGGNLSGGLQ